MVNLRDEQVLREMNLYPVWVRRSVPIQQQPMVKQIVNPPAIPLDVPLEVPHPSMGVDISQLAWTGLKQQVASCKVCKLRAGCEQTVFGGGDEQADWLFIGEDPSVEEEAPGKLLVNMLAAIQLKRGVKVYQTTVVKCKPSEAHTLGEDEIGQCLPYLHRQIALLNPTLIVALGKVAAAALLGKEGALASLRGTVHDYQGIPLVVTYHPAYLLRMPNEKAQAWKDLCFAVDTMNKVSKLS